MAHSTRRRSDGQTPPKKPAFPLWYHKGNGQWAKKIRGKRFVNLIEAGRKTLAVLPYPENLVEDDDKSRFRAILRHSRASHPM